MKRSVIASTAGVLVILSIAAYAFLGGDDAPVVYRFGKVEVGSIVNTVSASGTLKPATSVAAPVR